MTQLLDIISGAGSRDWEYLPEICLLRVLEIIDGPISLVRFGAVSRHWHSVFNIFLDIKRRSSYVPMLLIPSKKGSRKRKLFSLQAESKVSEIEFPKPYTMRCCGSCYGWLATFDDNFIVTLSNPFKNNTRIDLPRLDINNPEIFHHPYEVQKVVLSDDPLLHPSSYAVVVIYGISGRLAFYQSGRNDWIFMDKDESPFQDVIFHKNWAYAIGSWNNHLVSFDINCVEDNGKPKLNILVAKVVGGGYYHYSDRAYLVKSSMGNFYSVHKYMVIDDDDVHGTVHHTKEFKVFKLVLDDGNGYLVDKKEVESIDGDILFVGDNGSIAVSALYFPQAQPNSIYFTDDIFNKYNRLYETDFGPRDIGIYHVNDKSFGKYCQFKSSHKDLAPYIWVSPPVQLNSIL